MYASRQEQSSAWSVALPCVCRSSEEVMLKAVLLKTLVVAVGGVLVVPFVAASVLVGARAVAGAGGTRQSLVMFALALVWTLFGGVKGFARGAGVGRQGHEPAAARQRNGARRQIFLSTRGL
jgi:hypothetical protein